MVIFSFLMHFWMFFHVFLSFFHVFLSFSFTFPLLFLTQGIEFFRRHWVTVSLVGFVGIPSNEAVPLLSSRLFNRPELSLTWPEGLENRVGAIGVATTLLGDLPRFVIQIFVATQIGLSIVLFLTLLGSGAGMLVGLLRRIVLIVISRHQSRHSAFLSPEDKQFGIEMSGKTIHNSLSTMPKKATGLVVLSE